MVLVDCKSTKSKRILTRTELFSSLCTFVNHDRSILGTLPLMPNGKRIKNNKSPLTKQMAVMDRFIKLLFYAIFLYNVFV